MLGEEPREVIEAEAEDLEARRASGPGRISSRSSGGGRPWPWSSWLRARRRRCRRPAALRSPGRALPRPGSIWRSRSRGRPRGSRRPSSRSGSRRHCRPGVRRPGGATGGNRGPGRSGLRRERPWRIRPVPGRAGHRPAPRRSASCPGSGGPPFRRGAPAPRRGSRRDRLPGARRSTFRAGPGPAPLRGPIRR